MLPQISLNPAIQSLRFFTVLALLFSSSCLTAAVVTFQTGNFSEWQKRTYYRPSDDGDTLAVNIVSTAGLSWSALPSLTVGFFNTATAGFTAMPPAGHFSASPAALGDIQTIRMTAEARLFHSIWNFTDYAARVPWFLVEHAGTLYAYRFYGGNNNWGNDFNFETSVFTHEINFTGGGFSGREINRVEETSDGLGTRITTAFDLNDPANSPDFTAPLRFGIGWANSTGGGLEEGPSFGSIDAFRVTITYNPVPEPSAFLLALIAGGITALQRRRRQCILHSPPNTQP